MQKVMNWLLNADATGEQVQEGSGEFSDLLFDGSALNAPRKGTEGSPCRSSMNKFGKLPLFKKRKVNLKPLIHRKIKRSHCQMRWNIYQSTSPVPVVVKVKRRLDPGHFFFKPRNVTSVGTEETLVNSQLSSPIATNPHQVREKIASPNHCASIADMFADTSEESSTTIMSGCGGFSKQTNIYTDAEDVTFSFKPLDEINESMENGKNACASVTANFPELFQNKNSRSEYNTGGPIHTTKEMESRLFRCSESVINDEDNEITSVSVKKRVENTDSVVNQLDYRSKTVFSQQILNMTQAINKDVLACVSLLETLNQSFSEGIFSETLTDDFEALICICHDKICIVMKTLDLLCYLKILLMNNEEQKHMWLLHDTIMGSLQAYLHLRAVKSSDIASKKLLSVLMLAGKTLMAQSGLNFATTISKMKKICEILKKLTEQGILSTVCNCRNHFISLNLSPPCLECDVNQLHNQLCEDSEQTFVDVTINEPLVRDNIIGNLLPHISLFLKQVLQESPEEISSRFLKHKQARFLCNPDSGLYPCKKHCSMPICECFFDLKHQEPMKSAMKDFSESRCNEQYADVHSNEISIESPMPEESSSSKSGNIHQIPANKEALISVPSAKMSSSIGSLVDTDNLSNLSLLCHFPSEEHFDIDETLSREDIIPSSQTLGQNGKNSAPLQPMNSSCKMNILPYSSDLLKKSSSIEEQSSKDDHSNLSDSDMSKSTVELDNTDCNNLDQDHQSTCDAVDREMVRSPGLLMRKADIELKQEKGFRQRQLSASSIEYDSKEVSEESRGQKRSVTFRTPIIKSCVFYSSMDTESVASSARDPQNKSINHEEVVLLNLSEPAEFKQRLLQCVKTPSIKIAGGSSDLVTKETLHSLNAENSSTSLSDPAHKFHPKTVPPDVPLKESGNSTVTEQTNSSIKQKVVLPTDNPQGEVKKSPEVEGELVKTVKTDRQANKSKSGYKERQEKNPCKKFKAKKESRCSVEKCQKKRVKDYSETSQGKEDKTGSSDDQYRNHKRSKTSVFQESPKKEEEWQNFLGSLHERLTQMPLKIE